jgi:hypothetical protein
LDSNELTLSKFGSKSVFNLTLKSIVGDSFIESLILKDQLRRNGVRFRFHPIGGQWSEWSEHVILKESFE